RDSGHTFAFLMHALDLAPAKWGKMNVGHRQWLLSVVALFFAKLSLTVGPLRCPLSCSKHTNRTRAALFLCHTSIRAKLCHTRLGSQGYPRFARRFGRPGQPCTSMADGRAMDGSDGKGLSRDPARQSVHLVYESENSSPTPLRFACIHGVCYNLPTSKQKRVG